MQPAKPGTGREWQPSTRVPHLPPLLPSRLLLVGDDALGADPLRALLAAAAGEQCHVESVRWLREARSRLFSSGADCVLFEPRIAGAEGIKTAAAAMAGAHQVPVVVLSGLSQTEAAPERSVTEGHVLWGAICCATALQHAEMVLRRYPVPDRLAGDVAAGRPLEVSTPG